MVVKKLMGKEASVHLSRLTEFYHFVFVFCLHFGPGPLMGLGECCLVNIVSKKLHCVLKDKHSAGFRVAGGTNISTPQHPELILVMYKHPKLILVMYKQQIHSEFFA